MAASAAAKRGLTASPDGPPHGGPSREAVSWSNLFLFCSFRHAIGVGMTVWPYNFPPPENPRAAPVGADHTLDRDTVLQGHG